MALKEGKAYLPPPSGMALPQDLDTCTFMNEPQRSAWAQSQQVQLQMQSKKGSKKERAEAESMSTQDQENVDHNSMAAAPEEAQGALASAQGLAQYVDLASPHHGMACMHTASSVLQCECASSKFKLPAHK